MAGQGLRCLLNRLGFIHEASEIVTPQTRPEHPLQRGTAMGPDKDEGTASILIKFKY